MSLDEEKAPQQPYCYAYPHPAVTTDSVVFGFDGRQLHLLLIERGIEPFKGMWALPGGFVKIDETVEEGARRELLEETGVEDVWLRQFHVFSKVDRDPRERVITVAFLALVRKSEYRLIAGDDASKAAWFTLDELPPLAFDHEDIIEHAREALQNELKISPIAFKLVDKAFAISELQRLYEAINQTTYDRRNFYKKMNASGLLRDAGVVGEEPSCCCYSVMPPSDESLEEWGSDFPSPSDCSVSDIEEQQSARRSPAPEPKLSRKEGALRKGANLYSFNEEEYDERVRKDKNLRNPFLF